jgi:hypothetical protein
MMSAHGAAGHSRPGGDHRRLASVGCLVIPPARFLSFRRCLFRAALMELDARAESVDRAANAYGDQQRKHRRWWWWWWWSSSTSTPNYPDEARDYADSLARRELDRRNPTTHVAREAFLKRFEREVDPDGILPRDERPRRAERVERAYMLRLAKRAVKVRSRLEVRADKPINASPPRMSMRGDSACMPICTYAGWSSLTTALPAILRTDDIYAFFHRPLC